MLQTRIFNTPRKRVGMRGMSESTGNILEWLLLFGLQT
jgi:hypothetical protein